VNWVDIGASTLTGPTDIATADFDAELCGFSRDCIPQPGGSLLDTLGQYTMYRLAYRNFGDHEALIINHTVDSNGASLAGIRWAELRDPFGTPTVFQTGTYAPADGLNRWMGSINQDAVGNIALGFSVSSATKFPAIHVTGRLSDDPPGVMTQGELEIQASTVAQSGSDRWGDYATMSLDETDECTFWFTTLYNGGGINWKTKITAFKFDNCSTGPTGFVEGTVRSTGGLVLAGATVSAGALSTNTDASGHYRLRLPVGTVDLTASKFGFSSQTATVTIEADATTTQDFALAAASTTTVKGFVYDGSGASWPLYSRIDITATGAPTTTVFSHPLTGFYTVEVLTGTEYTFTVTPLIQGYVGDSRPVAAGGTTTTVNFKLFVDAGACTAPGYALATQDILSTDFEGTFPPDGWTVSNNTTNCAGVPDWTNTNPGARTNLTGGTGSFAISDSDRCGPPSNMDSSLFSPAIDLSGLGKGSGGALQIEFKSDYHDGFGGSGTVDVWDGARWTEALHLGPADDRGPKTIVVGSSAGNGRPDTAVRFHFLAPGWFWWWEVDDIKIRQATCEWQGGGLIYGFVTDANTGAGLLGATVAVEGGQTTTTFATPDDPAQGDGMYITYLPEDRHVTAHKAKYRDITELVIPQFTGVMRDDFNLTAGRIMVSPTSITVRVPVGSSAQVPLTLTNTGTADASFKIKKFSEVLTALPTEHFDAPANFVEAKFVNEATARAVQHAASAKPASDAELEAASMPGAGDVVAQFDTGLGGTWGVGFNIDAEDMWIGSIAGLGGDEKDHRFLDDGTNTGDTISASFGGVFAADMTYNPRTGNLWQVNVGGDNCVYELDPSSMTQTGNKICPNFGTSERGLAFDPVSNTFYAGSWNDGAIQQFDMNGNILRKASLGLDISGLAYNVTTKHLFALTNSANPELDVYVIDSFDLSIVSAFEVRSGRTHVFGDFAQAGLEMDCDGNLVAANQTTGQVFIAGSGETTECITDVPWLTVAPDSGTLAPSTSSVSTVTLDSASLTPGVFSAELLISTDTPYTVPGIPVSFTVAFADVGADFYADDEILQLAGRGVALGCGQGNFCPGGTTTTGGVTPWILRAKFGGDYNPPAATGLMFGDVSQESYAAAFIEDSARRGITQPCGGGNFCPGATFLRKDSAIVILKAVEGADFMPPPATGLFNDVPDDAFRPWIDELARRGITTGCGNGNFCPNQPLTRAELAVFLFHAFGGESD